VSVQLFDQLVEEWVETIQFSQKVFGHPVGPIQLFEQSVEEWVETIQEWGGFCFFCF
jgi:hypothetical protein